MVFSYLIFLLCLAGVYKGDAPDAYSLSFYTPICKDDIFLPRTPVRLSLDTFFKGINFLFLAIFLIEFRVFSLFCKDANVNHL